jgi:hypothetical protein
MKDSQVLSQLSVIRVSHFLGTSCVKAWSDVECKQFPYDMCYALQPRINCGCIFSDKSSFASSMRPDRLWVSASGSQPVGLSLWVSASGSQPVHLSLWFSASLLKSVPKFVTWSETADACTFPSYPQTKNTWIHNSTVPYAFSCRDTRTFTFI